MNRVASQRDVLAAALRAVELAGANGPLPVQASKRIARGIINGAVPAGQDAWKLSATE